MHPIWTNRKRGTWTSVELLEADCLVCVCGALDKDALQPCRAALDAALEQHPEVVVVDVSHTQDPEPATVPLLSAARRYLLARGATMVLAGVPEALMQALRAARVHGLYTFEDARWTEDSPIYLRSTGLPSA